MLFEPNAFEFSLGILMFHLRDREDVVLKFCCMMRSIKIQSVIVVRNGNIYIGEGKYTEVNIFPRIMIKEHNYN